MKITSTQNPMVKQLVKLRKRRERDATGSFLIEGYRELRRAVRAGVELVDVFSCPELFLGANERDLLDLAAANGARVIEMAEAPFRKVSYRDRPEGLIARARQFPVDVARLDLTERPLLLVVESIEKPGNLGTMLRTADAAGADAIIVCDPTTDPFNPNVVRASIGCLFTVPLAVADSRDTISYLHERGIRSFASTPATSEPYWDADYRDGSALVVGSEQYGLSDAWIHGADERVRIPMAGEADSLNAAMAAGILLFEAVRQRSMVPPNDRRE